MKALVIGGTGNISREVVAAQLRGEHEVVLFNRGMNGDAPPSDVGVIKGDRRNRIERQWGSKSISKAGLNSHQRVTTLSFTAINWPSLILRSVAPTLHQSGDI